MTRQLSVRDEYTPKFGRQTLTLWSGAFASDFAGQAMELPSHDGFMVTFDYVAVTEKVRVSCESPRTGENYQHVDAAIQEAFDERIREQTEGKPHEGHFSTLGGTWWCDTCNSPYCELA